MHDDAKSTEKDAALHLALSQLSGEFDRESSLSLQRFFGIRHVPVISTGSLKLDLALGIGGLPKVCRSLMFDTLIVAVCLCLSLLLLFFPYRVDLLKFMVEKRLGRPHLHFTLLRKLKSLEVCTSSFVSFTEIGYTVNIINQRFRLLDYWSSATLAHGMNGHSNNHANPANNNLFPSMYLSWFISCPLTSSIVRLTQFRLQESVLILMQRMQWTLLLQNQWV